MAQYDPQVIRSSFRGCVRTYYSYDDELYAGTFPEEWAQDHAPGTGPKECENCRNLCFNGVFLGYCGNCAIHVYNGTRCKGFISPGVELHNSYNHDYDSAFDLYLYEVNLHDVGDTDFHDTMAEIINRYASEFIHRNPRDVLAAFARMNDELFGNDEEAEIAQLNDELCGQGYGQVDIDYVIDAHNRRQANGPRPFDDGDDDGDDAEDNGLSMPEEDFDYLWDWTAEQNHQDLSIEHVCSMNTQESVPDPDTPLDESDTDTDMPLDESDTETDLPVDESDTETETEPDMLLDETVHCMICENTKYNCACDEDIIHQSVFCYTCENPRYVCECDEESRNKTHYCLDCEKVKYNCICVGENSVYMRVARKYCMQHC